MGTGGYNDELTEIEFYTKKGVSVILKSDTDEIPADEEIFDNENKKPCIAEHWRIQGSICMQWEEFSHQVHQSFYGW